MKKRPGHYTFANEQKQKEWVSILPRLEERHFHRHIADILMRELPDNEEKTDAVAHHLMHISNDLERCRYLAKAGDIHLKAFKTEDALRCSSKVLIERGSILSKDNHFGVPELGSGYLDQSPGHGGMTLKDNERRLILWALQKTDWKVRGMEGAAELLEIHPSTLAFRMKKLGIQRPKRPPSRQIT